MSSLLLSLLLGAWHETVTEITLLWGREGFAGCILLAGAPVIPVKWIHFSVCALSRAAGLHNDGSSATTPCRRIMLMFHIRVLLNEESRAPRLIVLCSLLGVWDFRLMFCFFFCVRACVLKQCFSFSLASNTWPVAFVLLNAAVWETVFHSYEENTEEPQTF